MFHSLSFNLVLKVEIKLPFLDGLVKLFLECCRDLQQKNQIRTGERTLNKNRVLQSTWVDSPHLHGYSRLSVSLRVRRPLLAVGTRHGHGVQTYMQAKHKIK